MKILRLFTAILSLSLRRDLAFRTDLLFQGLVSAAEGAAGLATLAVVYTRVQTIAGWQPEAAIILFGTFQIMSGVLTTYMEPNVAWFRYQILEGRLDDILLKPVPALFLASLGTSASWGLLDIATGIVLVGIGQCLVGTLPPWWHMVSWLILMMVGIVMTWSSRVVLASAAFWAPSFQPDVLYKALWQFGRYPVQIYQQPLRFILTYVVPIAFVATFPAQALTHGSSAPFLGASVLGGAGAILLVRSVWTAGLRRYTSATS